MTTDKHQKKPLISFLMPNYNNEHVLDLFFSKFVENNTYDNYEFIVVDDGSVDKGLEKLYKWQKTNLIRNFTIIAEPHKGIINALNRCLSTAKGDFIIRLDGDATIETRSFVEKFLDFYNLAPDKIGVITSKVIDDDGNLHAIGRNVICPEGLHDRGKVITELVGKRCWDCFSTPVQNLASIIDIPAEIDTALGVCTFSDRETALQIGGFDSNYPLWIEDDDFYLQYRLQGKKIFYLPDIEICHRFSLRGARNIDNTNKNKNLFIKKKVKGDITKYFLFGFLPLMKIVARLYSRRKKYYLFNFIPFMEIKYLSWRERILQQDYDYWKKKWGFNIINPDMADVIAKYSNTEILWRYEKEKYEEGQIIINKYIARTKNEG